MEYTHVIIHKANGIARIEMNSPQNLNPLDISMSEEILAAVEECNGDDQVKVIVLSGAGRAFCGGGDIHYMLEEVKKGSFDIRPLVRVLTELTRRLRQCGKPVLCAVQGAAAGGGCNLALACDMIVAEEKAKFLQAFVNIGLTPDTGGAYILPRLIGRTRAFEMFVTGRAVTAREMYNLGLITEVAENGKALERTMAMAEKLAKGPGVVYKGIKEMLLQSYSSDFDAFMRAEADVQAEASKTDDFVEGITAFLEKRKPHFTGK